MNFEEIFLKGENEAICHTSWIGATVNIEQWALQYL
jgi:hypothetical protein